MPYVQVNITEGATVEQKAQLVEGITDLLVRVLGKNPASTQVVIKESGTENWGIAGKTVKQLRAEGSTKISSK
ncbi:MAG: 4-oxalocrotonate tautomerase family protein [Desulfuromonadales bacterium]|nr:4-oxalocrotonate tautomerase family protein [Desulfuromonadales bacterium]